MTAWRKPFFFKGAHYQVRRPIQSEGFTFEQGEEVVFESEAWSRYDGATSYVFQSVHNRETKVWMLDDDSTVTPADLFLPK